MKKLNACPFCGQAPTLIRTRRYPDWPVVVLKKSDAWTIACENPSCLLYGARGRYYPSPDAAARAWNDRPDPVPESDELPDDLPADLRPWQREIQESPFLTLTL